METLIITSVPVAVTETLTLEPTYVLCIAILLALIPIVILTKKYMNPYKLVMVFGKKGSGKTTFLAKMAYRYIRKGRPVYSTVYIPGTYMFDVNNIGSMDFPSESVIFIDEVGMIWDNRNYKQFRTDVRDYFKLQRHYHHTVYLFSQTFDIDVKLRNLTDQMYLVKCYLGWFSVARRISRNIMLVEPTAESESRIADCLQFEPILFSLFGAKTIQFTFIPRWTRLFDSYDAPKLADNKSHYIPIPDNLTRFYHLKGTKHDKRRMVKYWISERINRIRGFRTRLIQRCVFRMVQRKMRNIQARNKRQNRGDL